MRRLPVYLLLDTSGSMHGEPIEAVRSGVQLLISSLQSDPYALETAYLSIITFNSEAKQVTPLTEMAAVQAPDIQAGGCTEMGAALKLLAQCVKTDVQKTTETAKGDWRPLVFIMTDGVPTDDITQGLEEIKKLKFGIIVGCSVGEEADGGVLKQITENVVQLATADSGAIKKFFKWVTASVSKSSSKPADDEQKMGDLPPPPADISII